MDILEDPTVRNRLTECIETILNKAQEPPKSKKVQHSNAKNAILFEAINLVIHMDCDANLLVRACNQLGQFLQHRETNLRYASVFVTIQHFNHKTLWTLVSYAGCPSFCLANSIKVILLMLIFCYC